MNFRNLSLYLKKEDLFCSNLLLETLLSTLYSLLLLSIYYNTE